MREAQSEIAPGVRRAGTPQIMADSPTKIWQILGKMVFDDDSAYEGKA